MSLMPPKEGPMLPTYRRNSQSDADGPVITGTGSGGIPAAGYTPSATKAADAAEVSMQPTAGGVLQLALALDLSPTNC